MILVDTSIWVTYLRDGDDHLQLLLIEGEVMCHSHIIGELACGNLSNRKEILSLLQALPQIPPVEFDEYLYFIEQNQLDGKDIGFVDIHLLASAKLARVKLWTADKRLNGAATNFGINYN
jgi:predicted nucleic acid-binding protein